ncbi:MAG: PilZ domain-containing protein [Myxococcales bacterium]|nr:PilZ domain-containing protein [Myxococcales bacterium]
MRLLRLRVRSSDEWRELMATGVAPDTLFVPTTDKVGDGEEVLVEVTAPSLPNKVVFRAAVHSWRPALPRLRVRAGASVHFATGEEHKRDFIGNALDGRAPDVPRRKHDRFPLTVPVRFRVGAELEFHDGTLIEVSAGGGLLATPTPPPIGADVVVELTPPGAAAAMTVAARVSYHTPQGAAGLRFVSRDGDGARRLRELVRRLVVE